MQELSAIVCGNMKCITNVSLLLLIISLYDSTGFAEPAAKDFLMEAILFFWVVYGKQ